MKVTIVDSATAIHGGLSWESISELTEVEEFPRTTADEVIARVSESAGVITNKVVFDREVIKKLPKLKYIGVTASGYNIIDVVAAREAGIAVTNVPGYSTQAVAQHVFALLLSYYSPIAQYSELVRRGDWSKSDQFCVLDYPIGELAQKTIGIVGHGEIGRSVDRIAKAFGMKVMVAGKNRHELEQLLPQCDIVTLHCPLTEQTKAMVDAQFLNKMKSEAVLVNTARGGLIQETDLARALKERKLAHAFLDVLGQEPPPANHPLIGLENITITPHVAWGTKEARHRLIAETVSNLAAFLNGQRRNRVD